MFHNIKTYINKTPFQYLTNLAKFSQYGDETPVLYNKIAPPTQAFPTVSDSIAVYIKLYGRRLMNNSTVVNVVPWPCEHWRSVVVGQHGYDPKLYVGACVAAAAAAEIRHRCRWCRRTAAAAVCRIAFHCWAATRKVGRSLRAPRVSISSRYRLVNQLVVDALRCNNSRCHGNWIFVAPINRILCRLLRGARCDGAGSNGAGKGKTRWFVVCRCHVPPRSLVDSLTLYFRFIFYIIAIRRMRLYQIRYSV